MGFPLCQTGCFRPVQHSLKKIIFGFDISIANYSDYLGKKPTRYWSRRACVRHSWWRTKRSWPLFSPTFFFFFFFFFFFLRLLLFTHFGESPVRENLFPPIFRHNQKI